MKAIELRGPSVDRLRRIELAAPAAPGPGRIHVRMRAASFNYIDPAVATGRSGELSYPLIPIADGVGKVVAVGPACGRSASATASPSTRRHRLRRRLRRRHRRPLRAAVADQHGVHVLGTNGGSVADLAGAMAIEPVIDRMLALGELAEGYRLLERGGHVGKPAITLDW